MKYITNLIALGVVGLLIFGVIKFKESDAYVATRWHVSRFFKKGKDFIEVKKHNIREEMKPARKRPISFMQIQGELENWMPDVFLEKFSDADWDEMWDLIYTPDKVDDAGYTVYRYKTREEVESILRYKHLDLSRLKDNDWWELWNIAKVTWTDD